jgi:hypothetical protein
MSTKTTSIQIEVFEGGFLLGYSQETEDGQGDFKREILVTERKLIDKIKSLLKDTATEPTAE